MSIDLGIAAAKFSKSVDIRRYTSTGSYTAYTGKYQALDYSPDVKRKSALFDRLGSTPGDSFLGSGDTALVRGDVLVISPSQSDEKLYIVGELIENTSGIRNFTTIGKNFDLRFCNARFSSSRISRTRDSDSQYVSSTPTTVLSVVPCAISSAQQEYFDTNLEASDEYFLDTPEIFDIKVGDVISFSSFNDIDSSLFRDKFSVLFPTPDILGISRHRVAKNKRS